MAIRISNSSGFTNEILIWRSKLSKIRIYREAPGLQHGLIAAWVHDGMLLGIPFSKLSRLLNIHGKLDSIGEMELQRLWEEIWEAYEKASHIPKKVEKFLRGDA